MTPPLDGPRRADVEANLDLIPKAVWQVRTPWLDEDERASAAQLGLCEAAALYAETGGDFRRFCLRRMRWRIFKDIRAKRLRACEPLADDHPDPRDHAAELDRRDLGARLSRKMGRMTGRQRQAVDLFLAGLAPGEIAARLGVSPGGFTHLFGRALAKLRLD